MKLKNNFFFKFFFLLIAYVVHGPIFAGTLDYVYALFVTFFLIFGTSRSGIKGKLFVIASLILILGYFVPRLSIAEQQLILVKFQQEFIPPKPVYITPQDFFKHEANYTYMPSADGYLQGLKDSRLVSTINYQGGVLGLRNGYSNHVKYNSASRKSTLERDIMPFVVKYIVTSEMVGMTLRAEGFFHFTATKDKINNLKYKRAQIKFDESHVGHSIYGFGGKWDDSGFHDLKFSLIKTPVYTFYEWLIFLSLFIGITLLFVSLFNFKINSGLKIEMLLYGGGAFLLYLFNSSLFKWGILVSGRRDGIRHAGYPYEMLESLISGDWFSALMSPEKVFYFMPGMRYIRFLEMMIFGDSYVFQICMLAAVPMILYRFYGLFLSTYISILMALSSTLFYIKSMLRQYGEWLSYALFFTSLMMMIRKMTQIRWGVLAFFFMAIAISIRPNLTIFIAVLGLIHLFTPLFSPLPFWSRFLMLFGLTPTLLMPLHNIIGGEFVLITSASTIPENVGLSPALYLDGLGSIFGFNDNFDQGERFTRYFKRMSPVFLPVLLASLWMCIRGKTPVIRSLAFASLAGLFVHLFYLAEYRYIFPYIHIILTFFLYHVQQIHYKNFIFHLRRMQQH